METPSLCFVVWFSSGLHTIRRLLSSVWSIGPRHNMKAAKDEGDSTRGRDGVGGSGPPRLEQRLPRMAPRSQRHESVTLNKRLAVVPGLEPVTQTVWITDRRSVTHRHMTAIPPIRTFLFFHHACFQDVETQWTLSLRQSE